MPERLEVQESEIVLNLRSEDTLLYEAESGDLFAETEMGTYRLSMVETGFAAVETEADTSAMELLEPAQRGSEVNRSYVSTTSEYDSYVRPWD